jgi:hypothetical protein
MALQFPAMLGNTCSVGKNNKGPGRGSLKGIHGPTGLCSTLKAWPCWVLSEDAVL